MSDCRDSGYSCTPGYTGGNAAGTWAWTYYGGSHALGPNGYHNCTLYTAWRLAQAGMADPGGSWGNAVQWASSIGGGDHTPAIGAVAWWGGELGGGLGHVAIVDQIDGSNVFVRADNWSGFTTAGWVAASSVDLFLHPHDVPPPPPPAPPAGDGGGNAASWAPDRLDTFVEGNDSHVWHKWFDGSRWNGYERDPGGDIAIITSQVATASRGDGRLDVFARSAGKSLLHKWFSAALGWSGWEDLGGCITDAPTVSSWGANRLDVFAQGCSATGNDMYHKWFDGAWHDWEVVPELRERITSAPSAVSSAAGRIDLVARGEHGELLHNWFDGSWHDADAQGGCIIGQPMVSAWEPGRLDVFAQGCNNDSHSNVYHKWFDGDWQAWETIPVDDGVRVTRMLGAVSWAGGRIDVFARGLDGAMQHEWYDRGWNHWESLGGGVAP